MTRATRMPKQVHDAVAAGLARGPVLVQTPRRGYAPSAGLRALPYAGPLRRLHRARWRVAGPAVPPGLPLVRHGRRRVGVCRVRSPRAPGAGGGRAAYGRGAGPGLRLDPGRGLGRRPRGGVGAGPAGGRGGHPGCRAGGRRRLRRRGPPRHLAGPGPARPAHRRGGAPPVARRRRRWSHPGGHVLVVGDPAHPGPPGARPLGPGRVRPARGGGPLRGPPATGQPARDDHRRSRSRRRRPDPARPTARHRGPRPGRGGRRRVAAGRPGAARPKGPRSPVPWERCSACARPASSTRCASRSTR